MMRDKRKAMLRNSLNAMPVAPVVAFPHGSFWRDADVPSPTAGYLTDPWPCRPLSRSGHFGGINDR